MLLIPESDVDYCIVDSDICFYILCQTLGGGRVVGGGCDEKGGIQNRKDVTHT